MKCKACGSEVPEGASFCILCGVHLETGSRANGDAPDSAIYPLLTAANLFRMRKDWVAAEQKCIEVLRLYPNNATAHSLLGDIYAGQGRWADAVQWYQMAVDLAADNCADRAKLERAQEQLGGGGLPEPAPASGERDTASSSGMRFSPLMQLTVVAVLAFAAALAVMGLKDRHAGQALQPTESSAVPLPSDSLGAQPSNAPAASLAPSASGSGAPAGTGGAGGATPPDAAPPASAAGGRTAAAMAPAPEMSEWEARAFSRLQTDPWIAARGAQIRVTSLVWEPIDQRALTTVVMLQGPSVERLRDEGLRTAYGVGQALARVGFQRFEVMVKAAVQDGRGTEVAIAAAADAARPQTWTEDAGTAPPEALLTRFTSIWWHPRLQQSR